LERISAVHTHTERKFVPVAKKPRTPTQLRLLVLAALRKVPGCEGVADITLRLDRARAEHNWAVIDCEPGTARVADCKRALAPIQALFQQMYELAPARDSPLVPATERRADSDFDQDRRAALPLAIAGPPLAVLDPAGAPWPHSTDR
jgi:hypothetical protein